MAAICNSLVRGVHIDGQTDRINRRTGISVKMTRDTHLPRTDYYRVRQWREIWVSSSSLFCFDFLYFKFTTLYISIFTG